MIPNHLQIMNTVHFIFSVVFVTLVADVTSRVIKESSNASEISIEIFLTLPNKTVPESYWKLTSWKDILNELRNKTDEATLNTYNITREDLTELYVAQLGETDRSEAGIILVPMSQEDALEVYCKTENLRKLLLASAVYSKGGLDIEVYYREHRDVIAGIEDGDMCDFLEQKPLCRQCNWYDFKLPFPGADYVDENELIDDSDITNNSTPITDVQSQAVKKSSDDQSDDPVEIFFGCRNKTVPEGYATLTLPRGIFTGLKNKIDIATLRAHNITRKDLTLLYAATATKTNRTDDGMVLVPLQQVQALSLYCSSEKLKRHSLASLLVLELIPFFFVISDDVLRDETIISESTKMPEYFRQVLCRGCKWRESLVAFPGTEFVKYLEQIDISALIQDFEAMQASLKRKSVKIPKNVGVYKSYKLQKKSDGCGK